MEAFKIGKLNPEQTKKAAAAAAIVVVLGLFAFVFDGISLLTGAVGSLGGSAQTFDQDGVSTEAVVPAGIDGAAGEQSGAQRATGKEAGAEAEGQAASDAALLAEQYDALARALDGQVAMIEVLPSLQNEVAWRALQRIADWNERPESVTTEMLFSYLDHQKLWVRLATLQFVLDHPGVSEANASLIESLRDRYVRGEHVSQVRRFLERAKAKDIILYQKMKELLRV